MDTIVTEWIDVCAPEDVPRQGSRIVKTPRGCLALFHTADGEFYALNDSCPHKKGPLSQGIVHGAFVTCPLHGFVISLESGEAQGADEGRVQTNPVRVQYGRVQIRLTVGTETQAA